MATKEWAQLIDQVQRNPDVTMSVYLLIYELSQMLAATKYDPKLVKELNEHLRYYITVLSTGVATNTELDGRKPADPTAPTKPEVKRPKA